MRVKWTGLDGLTRFGTAEWTNMHPGYDYPVLLVTPDDREVTPFTVTSVEDGVSPLEIIRDTK